MQPSHAVLQVHPPMAPLAAAVPVLGRTLWAPSVLSRVRRASRRLLAPCHAVPMAAGRQPLVQVRCLEAGCLKLHSSSYGCPLMQADLLLCLRLHSQQSRVAVTMTVTVTEFTLFYCAVPAPVQLSPAAPQPHPPMVQSVVVVLLGPMRWAPSVLSRVRLASLQVLPRSHVVLAAAGRQPLAQVGCCGPQLSGTHLAFRHFAVLCGCHTPVVLSNPVTVLASPHVAH
jgi:hypothetical protein